MMSIRYEDRLDDISNYIHWEVRITVVLKEWKIWNFANTKMTKHTDKHNLEEHESLEAKAQREILDEVKDHLIPHLAEKKIANDMWDDLKQLFEAKNDNRKIALKDKLHNVKMTQGESVTSYLTRVAQVKDELEIVGETISDSELFSIAQKGFTKK